MPLDSTINSILKFLDNVVKEYSYSMANLITAIICATFFPDRFELTIYIALSLATLFVGIFLYEKSAAKKIK